MPSLMEDSTCLSCYFWFHSRFCPPSGRYQRLSSCVFRFLPLRCWRYCCSPVLATLHNQALSPRVVDHKPGTLFITRTPTKNHLGTRRRGNSFASSETHPASFYRTSTLPT